MKIFTLHMIFGFLHGALLSVLIAVCFGGMPVAVGLMLAPVFVIYFGVFLSLVFGGSVISDGKKRPCISGKNNEAHAGECASRTLASRAVWMFSGLARLGGFMA